MGDAAGIDPQPSTVTDNGPLAEPRWTWTCSGSNGGNTANCSANYQAVINGVCKDYGVGGLGQSYPSQPATNNATGCDAGTYSDLPDDTLWRWRCNGINGGTNQTTCSAYKETPCPDCQPGDGGSGIQGALLICGTDGNWKLGPNMPGTVFGSIPSTGPHVCGNGIPIFLDVGHGQSWHPKAGTGNEVQPGEMYCIATDPSSNYTTISGFSNCGCSAGVGRYC